MESFIEYLDSHSPEDIEEPDIFLSALRNFLHRGGTQHRRQLLEILVNDLPKTDNVREQDTHHHVEKDARAGVEHHVQPLQEQDIRSQTELRFFIETPATCLRSRIPTPPRSRTSSPGHGIQHSSSTTSSSPEEYFRAAQFQALSRQRTDDLIKAAIALRKADETPLEIFDNLWTIRSGNGSHAATSDIYSRLNNLHQTSEHLKEQRALVDCASRFIGLFMRHEVDLLTSNKTIRYSNAYRQIEARTGFKNVKQIYHDARNYVEILELHGPGHLLRLGSEVREVWRRLRSDDVQCLLEYRKLHLSPPGATEHSRAASLCIQGLIAHGWRGDDLVKSRSNLISHLSEYIDCQRIAEETVVQCDQVVSQKRRASHMEKTWYNKRQQHHAREPPSSYDVSSGRHPHHIDNVSNISDGLLATCNGHGGDRARPFPAPEIDQLHSRPPTAFNAKTMSDVPLGVQGLNSRHDPSASLSMDELLPYNNDLGVSLRMDELFPYTNDVGVSLRMDELFPSANDVGVSLNMEVSGPSNNEIGVTSDLFPATAAYQSS